MHVFSGSRIVVTVGVLIATLAMAACGGRERESDGAASSGGGGSGDKGLVALSVGAFDTGWFGQLQKDVQKSFVEAGYQVKWTNGQGDPAKQLADIEALLVRKPKVLIVDPTEYKPLAPVVQMAESAGVPLLVVDRTLPGESGRGNWITTVTNNYVDYGRWLASDLVERLTKDGGSDKARVLHVTGTAGASPVIDMHKGIDEVLADHPGVKIVASCDGDYQREPARKCTEDLLQRFPKGDVDAIIYDNDEEALGGIKAIDAAGRDELVNRLWSKDATKAGLQALVDKKIAWTVQTPPTFGDLTLKAFEDWQAKNEVPPTIYTEPARYSNATQAGIEAAKARIDEMDAAGVDCC
jgi:ABC-type sugar transport system substrate-binding protein